MRKIVMTSIVLLLAGAYSFTVSAQGFMPWTDVFMMADGDHDGMVNMDEVKKFGHNDHFVGFMPFMTDHYKDLDRNKDGMVSMAEVKMFSKEQMKWTDPELSSMFYKGTGFMPFNQK